MFAAVCFLFLTYLATAVPIGLLVSTLFGGDEDIREAGSGNIGATNVGRVHGWALGGPVMALDIAKGLLPVLAARVLWPDLGVWWVTLVAVTAFVGHCYPVYLAFQGGKGVATGAGAMIAITPLPAGLAMLAWVLVLVASGRSSVASLSSTMVLVIAVARLDPQVLPVSLMLAVGITVSHVENIRRLVAGSEDAVFRPVRWGRSGSSVGPDPEALLAEGPAGAAAAAPPAWKDEPHPEAS